MSSFDALTHEEQVNTYQMLEQNVSIESQCLYEQALMQAETAEQRKACAGQYKGRWSFVLDAWLQERIDHLSVVQSLNLKMVSDELLAQCLGQFRTIH